jgi:hypothetical protein
MILHFILLYGGGGGDIDCFKDSRDGNVNKRKGYRTQRKGNRQRIIVSTLRKFVTYPVQNPHPHPLLFPFPETL